MKDYSRSYHVKVLSTLNVIFGDEYANESTFIPLVQTPKVIITFSLDKMKGFIYFSFFQKTTLCHWNLLKSTLRPRTYIVSYAGKKNNITIEMPQILA
jgi:hypothetical protein